MLVWIGSLHTKDTRFLFLDRDGILNQDSPDYIKHWREVKFYPDALDALRLLRQKSFSIVIISNQSGLNRGIIDWSDFWDIHRKMVQTIRDAGGDILAALYCPHRPDENCGCRKPSPSMLLAASRIYGIPLESSCFVGDRVTDMQAAVAAGSTPVLLERTPLGHMEWTKLGLARPPVRIQSLREAESLYQGNP